MSKYSVIHRGHETVYKSRLIASHAYKLKVARYPNSDCKMLVDGEVVHEHKDVLQGMEVPYYILETNSGLEGIQYTDEATEAFYDARDVAIEEDTDVILTKVVRDKSHNTGYNEFRVRSWVSETGTTLVGE
jgi:hypothetical protein